MKKKNLQQDTIILALRQAGIVARDLEGRVTNESKDDPTILPNDDDALRAQRAAKTVVDEIVQDILLLAVFENVGSQVILDAEEKSSMKRLFQNKDAATTLVIDPIDGTVEYLAGHDSYSICIGYEHGGKFMPVYVYFPRRDKLYWTTYSGVAYVAENISFKSLEKASPIQSVECKNNIVYVNGRVANKIQTKLRLAGYEVRHDTDDGKGVPDCLIECMEGKAICYISHTRQMRDIMLGAVIAGLSSGFALDWRGKNLQWPSGGRVPRAVFGVGTLPDSVMNVLKNSSHDNTP